MTFEEIKIKVKEFMDWVQEHNLTAIVGVVDLSEITDEARQVQTHSAACGTLQDVVILSKSVYITNSNRLINATLAEEREQTERN